MADYKPEGYASVSPYLVVDSAQEVVDFLKRAFDGVEVRRYEADDGRIQHVEVKIDDSVIMLGDALEGWPAQASSVHVYVPDVNKTYQRALAAGGESLQEPSKGDDPDKRGGVMGPGGISWWMATQVD